MSRKPKHIFLIIADSLRYDSVYQNGDSGLDYIAKNSTEFTNVTSPACWTLPSTASLFTGQLPHEHGATSQSRKLKESSITLAQRLKESGYKTYQITANVATTEIFGLDKGFDEVHKTWDFTKPKSSYSSTLLLMLSKPRIRKQLSISKDVVTRALAKDIKAGSVWIESHMVEAFDKVKQLMDENDKKGQPCFFFVNLMESHFPYHINTTYKALSKGPIAAWREMKHMYNFVNQNFLINGKHEIPAKILTTIQERQKLSWKLIRDKLDVFAEELHSGKENLVVFGSDHGENFGDQDWVYHFSNVTDACTRVPLFWLAPGHKGNQKIKKPKNSKSIYNAILHAAGLEEDVDSLFTDQIESIPISQTYWYNNKNQTRKEFIYNQFAFNLADKRYVFRQDAWHEGVCTDYENGIEEQKFEKISASDQDVKDIIGNQEFTDYIFDKLNKYRTFQKNLLPQEPA